MSSAEEIPISDIPQDFVPAGCEVVIGFDPATGDSVTAVFDPSTGITHIQAITVANDDPQR